MPRPSPKKDRVRELAEAAILSGQNPSTRLARISLAILLAGSVAGSGFVGGAAFGKRHARGIIECRAGGNLFIDNIDFNNTLLRNQADLSRLARLPAIFCGMPA